MGSSIYLKLPERWQKLIFAQTISCALLVGRVLLLQHCQILNKHNQRCSCRPRSILSMGDQKYYYNYLRVLNLTLIYHIEPCMPTYSLKHSCNKGKWCSFQIFTTFYSCKRCALTMDLRLKDHFQQLMNVPKFATLKYNLKKKKM